MKIPGLFLLGFLAMPSATLAQQPASAPIPGHWRIVPGFSDEFNAPQLDSGKWQPKNPEWPGRPPGLYLEKNVVIKDGKLHLKLKAENVPDMPAGYKDYTCAIVRSQKRIRYGYFEIRCQVGNSAGTSAFWLYHNEPERWTEIDIFELAPGHPKYGRTLFTNAPVFRYPGLSTPLDHKQEFPLQDNPATTWHTWALQWDADLLTFFLDGKPLRSLANTYWKTPLRLIFDTETHPGWMGLPDPAALPATFVIDYVRTWQAVTPGK